MGKYLNRAFNDIKKKEKRESQANVQRTLQKEVNAIVKSDPTKNAPGPGFRSSDNVQKLGSKTMSVGNRSYTQVNPFGLPDRIYDMNKNNLNNGDNPGLFRSNLIAGQGQAYAYAGGAFDYIGQKLGMESMSNAGKGLVNYGDEMIKKYSIPYSKPFTWKSLADPEFYQTSVAQAAPIIGDMILGSVIGAAAGGMAAGAAGLGAFGTSVLTAVGGGGLTALGESFGEAGSVFEESLNRGLSPEEADNNADKAFWSNVALQAKDPLELLINFTPLGRTGKIGKAIAKAGKLGKAAEIGGKVALTGAANAGEEVAQNWIQSYALGDKFDWNSEENKVSGTIGALYGISLSGAGAAYNAVKTKTIQKMDAGTRDTFDKTVNLLQQQGMDRGKAADSALNMYAESDAGKKAINDSVDEIVSASEIPTTINEQASILSNNSNKPLDKKTPTYTDTINNTTQDNMGAQTPIETQVTEKEGKADEYRPEVQRWYNPDDETRLSDFEEKQRSGFDIYKSVPAGERIYRTVGESEDSRIAKEVSGIFGHNFVRFGLGNATDKTARSHADIFNGMIYKDTVFVNETATNPAHAVAGHEITHAVLKDKEIRNVFINEFKVLLNEQGESRVKQLVSEYSRGGVEITEDQAVEELAGDFIGEQMTKQEFWDRLSNKVPEAVKKAIVVIKKMIAGLKGKSKMNNQAEMFIKDLEKARDLAANALAEHINKQAEEKSGLTDAEKETLAFFRKQGMTLNSAIAYVEKTMNQMVTDHIEYLKRSQGQGVDQGALIRDEEGYVFNRMPRISRNPKWYQEFYSENGRKPNKSELKELAIQHLKEGFGDVTMDIPANEEYLELEGLLNGYKRIEEKLSSGVEKKLPQQEAKSDAGAGEEVRYQSKEKSEESLIDRIYYRGTIPNETKRIKTENDIWDNNLFISDNEEYAKAYGSKIEKVVFKNDARILKEGTKEFNKLIPKQKNNQMMLDWLSKVISKAKEAGYDAVYFNKQGDTGTVVMNQNAVIRNYEAKKDTQYSIKNPKPWTDQQQEIDSKDTSINSSRMPRTFSLVKFTPGTINADIGGGRFDNVTEFLASQGVKNYIYDPFNRTKEHNDNFLKKIKGGKADTATVNNVLNVIQEEDAREQVIINAADAIKGNGTAYFLIYEGDKTGKGKVTSKGWQENRATKDYVSEIEKHFNSVRVKNGVIEAKEPIKTWDTQYSIKSEAFKKWFGESKVVDKQGNPLVVYHGTTKEFSVFNTSPGNLATNTKAKTARLGAFFTENLNTADAFADSLPGSNIMPVYLKMESPLIPEKLTAKEIVKLEESFNGITDLLYETNNHPVKITTNEAEKLRKENTIMEYFKETNDKSQTRAYEDMEARKAELISKGYRIIKEGRMSIDFGRVAYTLNAIPNNIPNKGYGRDFFKILQLIAKDGEAQSKLISLGYDGIIVDTEMDAPTYNDDWTLFLDKIKQYIVFSPTQIKSATGNKGSFDSSNSDIRYQLKVDSVMKETGYDKTKAENLVNWFGESKVVNEKGMPKPMYSGHSNAELYGDYFDPKKATAGGFFTTDNPEIASSYASDKMGVKELWENGDQYRIYNPKTKKFNKKIGDILLTDEQLAVFNNYWQENYGFDLKDHIVDQYKYDRGLRQYQYRGGQRNLEAHWRVLEYMGDNIAYAKDGKEPVYMRQQKNTFEELLDEAGIRWQSYDWMQPGVMKVYLKIENPLDTSKTFPKDAMEALEKVARREKRLTDDELIDSHWTKDYPIYQWLKDIKKMADTSEETFWATQVPTKARDILKKLGYDGIKDLGGKMGGEGHEVWIAFDSNQIKSATGNKGTFNPDKKNMQFQLKEGFKGDYRVRGFSKNVATDSYMNTALREWFDENPLMYEVLSNKETLAKAQEIFDKGFDAALTQWFNNLKNFDPADVPLARLLANEAAKRGDFELARGIVSTIAEKLTQAGQYSQAGAILRKVDPETFLVWMNRQIDKLNEQGNKLYGKKWNKIELTKEEEQRINDAKTEEEREIIQGEIAQRITNQLPVNTMEKFDAWRRVAMLLNPKTHIRNILGNGLMAGLASVSDIKAFVMESALSKAGILKPGQRTKDIGWRRNKKIMELVDLDWEVVKKNLTGISKYDIENLKFLDRQKPIFKTKWIETLNTFTNELLNRGDIPFLRHAYTNALGQYLSINGLTKVTDNARSYARRRALEATFKESNQFSKWIIEAKKKYKWGGKMIDTALPFVTTPSNIFMRAVDYSPLGLFKTMFMSNKPPEIIIESLAKGLTGSSILILGYMLAAMGLARGADKKSAKAEQMLKQMGNQPYSISLFGGTCTFDWIQPFAVPLAMGIVFYEKLKSSDKVDADSIKDAIATGGDTLFSMSMLKGIRDFLGGAFGSPTESFMGLPTAYIQQAIPTVLGQVARIIDPTRRSTYDTSDFGSLIRSWESKIPVLSKNLEPKLDLFGNEQKQGGAFEQLFSPGYFAERNNDPVMVELERLYKATKESDFLPKYGVKKFTVDGVEYELTPEEVTTFQIIMGQANLDDMYRKINSSKYQQSSDEKKRRMLRKVVEDNYDMTKDEIMKTKLKK